MSRDLNTTVSVPNFKGDPLQEAQACFEENQKRIHKEQDPNQWRLYEGLLRLCDAVQEIQSWQRNLDMRMERADFESKFLTT
jgi:hypothetical protein